MQRDADLAVEFESANSGAVSRTRINSKLEALFSSTSMPSAEGFSGAPCCREGTNLVVEGRGLV